MLMFCICTVYYPVTKASNCVAVVDVLLWLMLLCVICLQPTIYEIFAGSSIIVKSRFSAEDAIAPACIRTEAH